MGSVTTQAVQYVRTTDGASIAYCVEGEGPTLVTIPSAPISHVQRSHELFEELFEALAGRFRHVWYDSRGSGLSDRKAMDFTLDARLRDLEAVLAQTARGLVALSGGYDAVPVAIAYAAHRPEDVSHLVLIDGWSKYLRLSRNDNDGCGRGAA